MELLSLGAAAEGDHQEQNWSAASADDVTRLATECLSEARVRRT